MSEMEQTVAKRLDSVLSIMTPMQRAVFIARGEGLVEGYKLGQADAQSVQPAQAVQAVRPTA